MGGEGDGGGIVGGGPGGGCNGGAAGGGDGGGDGGGNDGNGGDGGGGDGGGDGLGGFGGGGGGGGGTCGGGLWGCGGRAGAGVDDGGVIGKSMLQRTPSSQIVSIERMATGNPRLAHVAAAAHIPEQIEPRVGIEIKAAALSSSLLRLEVLWSLSADSCDSYNRVSDVDASATHSLARIVRVGMLADETGEGIDIVIVLVAFLDGDWVLTCAGAALSASSPWSSSIDAR